MAIMLVVSYLLGSLSGALLLGRLRGVDIRTLGSGNAGATNALRTQGKGFALFTALIDVAKGSVAAWLIAPLAGPEAWRAFAGIFAAVVGHCFPLFFGFRGGKGASTAIGGLAVVALPCVGVALAVWLLVLVLTGYVGLSTVLAAVAAAGALIWLSPVAWPGLAFAYATLALVVVMHHGNLRRLAAGTEARVEKVRIWKRWRHGA